MQRLLDVPAPAKLNLFLHVTGRRADGYHELQSVFRLIDWADTLVGRLRAQRHAASGCPLGAHIVLEKRIPQQAGAYTWNKAPRLAGEVVETGAIARQVVDGHPLLRDALARHGGTVFTRVLARVLELARVIGWMEAWLHALRPGQPYCVPANLPAEGRAAGLSEAARKASTVAAKPSSGASMAV